MSSVAELFVFSTSLMNDSSVLAFWWPLDVRKAQVATARRMRRRAAPFAYWLKALGTIVNLLKTLIPKHSQ